MTLKICRGLSVSATLPPRIPAWTRGLSIPKAAVDVHDLPGDELRGGGSEEAGGAGHVLRRSPAAGEGLAAGAVLPVLGGLFAPGRFDPAGSEAIDPHLWSERVREAFRKAHHRSFDAAEHFAAVAGHTLQRLVPADVQNDRSRRAGAAAFHFFP